MNHWSSRIDRQRGQKRHCGRIRDFILNKKKIKKKRKYRRRKRWRRRCCRWSGSSTAKSNSRPTRCRERRCQPVSWWPRDYETRWPSDPSRPPAHAPSEAISLINRGQNLPLGALTWCCCCQLLFSFFFSSSSSSGSMPLAQYALTKGSLTLKDANPPR